MHRFAIALIFIPAAWLLTAVYANTPIAQPPAESTETAMDDYCPGTGNIVSMSIDSMEKPSFYISPCNITISSKYIFSLEIFTLAIDWRPETERGSQYQASRIEFLL